jgi:voltage-gated potassium channel
MARPRRSNSWQTGVGNLVAVLVLYFVVPVNTDSGAVRLVVGVLGSLAAIGVMGFFVLRAMTVGPGNLRVRPLRAVHLILALEIVLVVFALVYYNLAINTDDQIVGIGTRLDSLYFTAVTMGTVGFGDIHPVGQLARGLVTAQILFDVAFIAAFAGLFRGVLQNRIHGAGEPDDQIGR